MGKVIGQINDIGKLMRAYAKVCVLIFISVLVWTVSHSQTSERVIDSLIMESLQSKVVRVTMDEKRYIEPNKYTVRLKDNFPPPYQLLAGKKLFNTAYHAPGRSIQLIRIVPRIISNDTIDINRGLVSMEARKGLFFNRGLYFRKAVFMLSCGGTDGYQPNCRYVYNARTATWERCEKTSIKDQPD